MTTLYLLTPKPNNDGKKLAVLVILFLIAVLFGTIYSH